MTENKDLLTLAIFGQTGSGKTSLSNALFGLNWLTDDAVACTKAISEYTGTIRSCFNGDQTSIWRLLDTPGIGESETADKHNFQMLYAAFHSADVIMWVVQADSRAFTEAQKAILRLTDCGLNIPNSHFLIALNQVDRVHPENWNCTENRPSKAQDSIIQEKINLIIKRFSKYLPISEKHIFPCSAAKQYGVIELIQELSFSYSKKSWLNRIQQGIKLKK
ncbi:MAG: GTPase family protein [Planktothrix sp.]